MPITWLTPTTPAHGLTEPDELFMSQSETWGNEKVTAQVGLKALWSQRHGIMNNILANAKVWPYHTNGNVFAVSGSISPFEEKADQDGSGLIYPSATLVVNFETLTKSNNPQNPDVTIFSESLEPTAEFLTVPYKDFKWGSITGKDLKKEEAPGRLEIGLDYVVTFYNMKVIPSAVLTLIGAVNNGPVTSASLGGLTFASETLLFNPPKIVRNVTAVAAQNRYTITLRFTYRRNGWNQFWRAETGTFSRIFHKDRGGIAHNNFPLASFASVLP